MNIIIYKIDCITMPVINIFITKNNKKPLHNKAYREVWTLLSDIKLCPINIYIEHCLCIQYNITPKYAYNIKPTYIHISYINNKYLKQLTYNENIEIQKNFSKIICLVDNNILNLLNMALYNDENKCI